MEAKATKATRAPLTNRDTCPSLPWLITKNIIIFLAARCKFSADHHKLCKLGQSILSGFLLGHTKAQRAFILKS